MELLATEVILNKSYSGNNNNKKQHTSNLAQNGKNSNCYPLVLPIPWRRERLPSPVFLGFLGSSDGKESACNAGDLGSIPGLGRLTGGGHGNPLQCCYLENPQGQRCLAGYGPWGHKESDTTEGLSKAQHM